MRPEAANHIAVAEGSSRADVLEAEASSDLICRTAESQTHKRPGNARPPAERCSSLVMGDFEVSRLRAAEVEIAVVQVEVIEADIAEVAVLDVRLRSAVAAEALGPAEIEPAAVGVDVGEVDVVEVAVFDAGLRAAVAAEPRLARRRN